MPQERKEQQLHFKIRVLDLIEVVGRRQAASPVLLLLPLPLLRILSESAAQPAQRVLFERSALGFPVVATFSLSDRHSCAGCDAGR